jgi:O-antigen/teichoic acid export membrane protein
MTQSIQSKMMRGAAWMVLFKLLDRSLGFVSTLILARLLTPAAFGIVAMAMTFVMMAEVLTSFGFDIALIQNREATDEHFHSAWTCNVILGAVVSVLLLGLAWPVTHFYGHPEVLPVLLCLAFCPLFASLENIGVVKFRKELQFNREFKFRATRRVLTFAATVPLAFLLRNQWALVTGLIVSKLGGSLLSYVSHEFRPRFMLTKARELMNFSRWMVFNNVLLFFRERSTDFFVGRLHGAASLGVYNMSSDISNMATVELSASINRALLPSFSKINDPNELRDAYRTAMSMLALASFPAAAGIFAVAPFMVPVVLGRQWLEAVTLIPFLAMNGVLLLFHSSIGSLLIARGFPRLIFRLNFIYLAILLPTLFVIGGRWEEEGVAGGVLFTSLLTVPLYLHFVHARLVIGPAVFLGAVYRPAIAALVMAFAVRTVLPPFDPALSQLREVQWLAAGVATGVAVYASVLMLLWVAAGKPNGAERLLIDKARFMLKSRVARRT